MKEKGMNIRIIELAYWCSCELIASVIFSKLVFTLHHGIVEVTPLEALEWHLSMWPPKTKLIYDVTCPLSSEITKMWSLHLLLLAVWPIFFPSPGERDEQDVCHLKAGECVGRSLVSFGDIPVLLYSVGAIWATFKIRSYRVDEGRCVQMWPLCAKPPFLVW